MGTLEGGRFLVEKAVKRSYPLKNRLRTSSAGQQIPQPLPKSWSISTDNYSSEDRQHPSDVHDSDGSGRSRERVHEAQTPSLIPPNGCLVLPASLDHTDRRQLTRIPASTFEVPRNVDHHRPSSDRRTVSLFLPAANRKRVCLPARSTFFNHAVSVHKPASVIDAPHLAGPRSPPAQASLCSKLDPPQARLVHADPPTDPSVHVVGSAGSNAISSS